ncbi:MAG: Kae1-associated serine/threonine protein kinase [Candidatus Aenigmarchaeota archaeon]|nr:Kae1-associated serine/threonine protein kinase [Candidatus Aenigmarchaeota archaeon]
MTQNLKKLHQAAEAVIYLDKKNKKIIKERIKKGYRIREIDERLRGSRTRLESRLIRQAAEVGVKTPRIINVKKYTIEMEYIDGEQVKNVLSKQSSRKDIYKDICSKIGEAIAKLHENNIIHGDLTTSNMILKEGQIYFIDFGLGFHSARVEDKATDLHLLRQAFESTHFNIIKKAWPIILEAYQKNYPAASSVLKRIEKIQSRGRYRKRRQTDK